MGKSFAISAESLEFGPRQIPKERADLLPIFSLNLKYETRAEYTVIMEDKIPKRAFAQTAILAVFSMIMGRVGIADEFWGIIVGVKSRVVEFWVALSDDGVVIVTIGFWGTVGRDFRARKSRQTGDRVAKRGRCPHLIFKNSVIRIDTKWIHEGHWDLQHPTPGQETRVSPSGKNIDLLRNM